MNFLLLCDYCWGNIIPSLWWGVVVLIVLITALCIAKSIIENHIKSKQQIIKEQYSHEKEMKDEAFKRELKWQFIKEAEKTLKIENNLKNYQKELKELKEKEKDLNDKGELLNEKELFEKDILETKIKVYEEIIKTINK